MKPDFIVQSVELLPSPTITGARYDVRVRVKNVGDIAGDVGGGLRLTGAIDVNGYRIESRLTQLAFELLDQGDDDIDAGSAVIIAGSVNNGVFIAENGRISLTSGSSAAVEITADDETITLGEVLLPDDFNNAEADDDTDPDAGADPR